MKLKENFVSGLKKKKKKSIRKFEFRGLKRAEPAVLSLSVGDVGDYWVL